MHGSDRDYGGEAMRRILAVLLVLWAVPAWAQNATTVGTLSLNSTFDCISVTGTFTGDADADNSATIEYKATSSGTWLAAYTPMVDRRATIEGGANPYINQFRGAVVGLSAGTSYDVRITYADGDGVTGGPTLSSAVTTISTTVPGLTGTTHVVTNDSELAAHLDLPPGDTVVLEAGTYSPFTISVSGTATNWTAYIGADRDTTFINGGTTDLTISANYIQVKNLRFKKPTTSGTTQGNVIAIGASAHHVWLDNLHLEDLPLPAGGSSYGNSAVAFGGTNHHIYVLNSLFHAPSLASRADGDYDLGGFGVQTGTMTSDGTFVIKGNTFDGKFQDSIGGYETYGNGQFGNSDIANNTISGFSDDGIQAEGDANNVRIWGNTITVDHGNSAIAQQASYVGPSYLFRNLLLNTRANTTFKVNGAAYPFIFHNTVDVSTANVNILSGSLTGAVVQNNLWRGSTYSILEYIGTGNTLNYNLYYPNTNLCYLWNGTTSYDTLANFRPGTSQEAQGVTGDPLFLNAAKQIDATSPAYNVGVALANFNAATSAWPALGAGPDLGYYEVGSGSAPNAPVNVRIR